MIENNIKNNKKYIIENNFLDKSDGILFKSHSMKCISKPQINMNNYQLSKSFATLKKKKCLIINIEICFYQYHLN